jgi:hypothetical protein
VTYQLLGKSVDFSVFQIATCDLSITITDQHDADMAKQLDGIDVEAAKRDDRDPERWGNFRKQETN